MKDKQQLTQNFLPYDDKEKSLLNENTTLDFPDGIPAFESAKRFIIITNDDIYPFLQMKSLDINDLSFVCVDPFLIYRGYSVNIPEIDQEKLKMNGSDQSLTLSFVTVYEDPEKNTANLLAPIVINLTNRVGRQVILEKYPVRYNIWQGLESFNKKDDAELC